MSHPVHVAHPYGETGNTIEVLAVGEAFVAGHQEVPIAERRGRHKQLAHRRRRIREHPDLDAVEHLWDKPVAVRRRSLGHLDQTIVRPPLTDSVWPVT